jgi:hypothetical protein
MVEAMHYERKRVRGEVVLLECLFCPLDVAVTGGGRTLQILGDTDMTMLCSQASYPGGITIYISLGIRSVHGGLATNTL